MWSDTEFRTVYWRGFCKLSLAVPGFLYIRKKFARMSMINNGVISALIATK
jgi:hypothetical protein